MEDEKLAVLGLSDQVPTAQGLLQATPTPSPYSTNQVRLQPLDLLEPSDLDSISLLIGYFLLLQLPAGIPNIGSLVVINQKLNSLGLHIHFQRFEAYAIV